LADEGVMNTLFKCLLDCHPNFVPPEADVKHGKKQAKDKEKIPKAHIAPLKKNKSQASLDMHYLKSEMLLTLFYSVKCFG